MQGLHRLLLLYVLTGLGQNGHGISGGEIVPESKMQYMVSLQDGLGNHLCGGFLVSKNFLITSASCDQPDLKVVYYGSHNLEEKRKYVRIEKRCSDSDIMLLKLEKNVIGDNVKTIEIPNSKIDLEVNQQCVVAGPEKCERGLVKWRKMINSHHEMMTVVSVFDCTPDLPANVICAGGYEKGFCELDAGGPLVCDGKVVGVVFSKKRKLFMSLYTNISGKHEWIRDKMNNPKGKDCRYM